MRVAKLETKILLAMMLLGYDYTIVDGHGKQTTRSQLPVPNRNDNMKVSDLLIPSVVCVLLSMQALPKGKPV